jgi:hypothetical protein
VVSSSDFGSSVVVVVVSPWSGSCVVVVDTISCTVVVVVDTGSCVVVVVVAGSGVVVVVVLAGSDGAGDGMRVGTVVIGKAVGGDTVGSCVFKIITRHTEENRFALRLSED